ncbi:MAG TPA: hypothetical protein VN622_18395 [Clostridia bacterium]|nr:hypothetical protein [Clostridia bacterium]
MRSVWLTAAVLLAVPHLQLQAQARRPATTPLATTTTLALETGNNTSAVRGSPENGNVDPGNVSKLSLHSLLYPHAITKIYVRYMPWFGDPKHRDVGYRSDDPSAIARQVQDMMSRGIDGAIVDWYGAGDKFKNRCTELLLTEAERRGFSLAISVDKGTLKNCESKRGCNVTQELIAAMRYVNEHFARSPAYVRVNGRPLMTFFGLEHSDIDWGRARRSVPGNPLLLFRNSEAFKLEYGDGAFSWIAPETVKPGDARGFQYLERFHKAARENPRKFVMASVYKGFDNRLADWGKGRKIAQDCGRTWLGSFREVNGFYSEQRQLPALIIPTWNDYEEGTEIETGIDNCVKVEASIRGTRLHWEVDGPKETIDHFTVFASQDGRNLAAIADSPSDGKDLDLSAIRLGPGEYTIFVKAVAKPSLLNHMSNPVLAKIGKENKIE